MAHSKSGLNEVIAVSTSKIVKLVLFDCDRSAIYTLYSVGVRILAYGTPIVIPRINIIIFFITSYHKVAVYEKKDFKVRYNGVNEVVKNKFMEKYFIPDMIRRGSKKGGD
jgi:hypothetical protein